MNSLYTRILAWLVLTLVFAFVGFVGTSWFIASRTHIPGGVVGTLHRALLANLVSQYEQGGREALRKALAPLNQDVHGSHALANAATGRDLLTGEDLGAIIQSAARPPGPPPLLRLGPPGGRRAMVHSSADGRYLLVSQAEFPGNASAWLPLYFWILIPVALFAWLLAARIASPLRRLESVVVRFGAGDLTARLNWTRTDEFGRLGRAFDDMAQRLETLLTAERRLLQDVSHELRSPLARLRFASELARSGSTHSVAFDRIDREVARLTELVETLLEVTRAEGDPAAARRLPLDLAPLLEQVVHDAAIEAEAQNCTLNLADSPRMATTGDPELLRRAIDNVLRNAIRHAPAGTAIDIALSAEQGVARIEVRDRGAGVPADLLERIFQPFVRAESDRGRASGGAGLGLSITARALALHHGRAFARNAHPGLAVTLELPEAGAAA
jgi:two-component system sensor histidine kinase CpxA